MAIFDFFSTAQNFALNHIDNKIGLYALIGIVVMFIIYLIRPKPLHKTIPSLIFLVKDKGKSKKESFFQKLIRDLLLIFHFLLIASLAVAAMQPFFYSEKDISKEHTVLVIDTSASMNADDLFNKAITKSKSYLEGKTSIILVDNEPFVLLDGGKEEEAFEIINKIKPSHGLSGIGNSILAAGDLLSGEKGRVVVISDFVNTDSVEPLIAKKTLEAKGTYVEFVDLNMGNANNIGIVNADLSEKESKITIHNFNEKSVKFDVDLNGDKKSVSISPNMDEKITLINKEGDNKVKLLIKDDFELDNEIHILTPVKKKIKVLLITNEEKSFILPALTAYKIAWNSNVEVEIAAPPKMPPINHDVFIISKVDKGKLPSAAVDKIERLVKKEGAGLIVTGFEGLEKSKASKLLPVKLGKLVTGSTDVYNLQAINEVTNDLSFSKTDKYFQASLKKGGVALASGKDNATIIAVANVGGGKVAYYGIFDSESKFKFDVSYPIFWQQMIDYLISAENINNLNYRAGEKILFDDEMEVQTPTKKVKVGTIEFNEIGKYSLQGREVYVNLLSQKESSINFKLDSEKVEDYKAELGTEESKKRLITWFIYGILILLFLELLYVKVRGDL
ncbi:VWA domain-containing protein [Candidatus Woesearchaeota archaeon]|nr:VWA domain-containing protein [Candidatus Woesearchaeota archaeon]MBT5272286.1 VWA domain-containing protein [Candidatus Woesearchaeota archaeon]MBT6336558.1 VWA domain-containing protein [Candidatus Woesearchaeota archaeon]MBT7927448.1 VWA domain-containing protein [Candidatus Woesearchaeota archaeon]